MSRAKAIAFALPLLSASLVAACASTGGEDKAASEQAIEAAMAEELAPATPEEIEAARRADPLTKANFWGKEFRKDPTKLDVTVEFMQALREIGSHERAIEIGSKTLPIHPESAELHIVMARALMSENRPAEAADFYYRAAAIAPENADAYGGLGLALDQMERHEDAQASYEQALRIQPGRVSTLANYGLSLALTGNLNAAEAKLRAAASSPDATARVRQNLALVLGLQGKFDEARQVDPAAPDATVEQNMQTLKSMLSPLRDYGALREEDDFQPSEGLSDEQQVKLPALRGSLSQ